MSSGPSNTRRQLSAADLTPEQQAAITRLVEFDETFLVAGMGFGKAVVGLTALAELHAMGALKRTLVLAPKMVCDLTFASERYLWEQLAGIGIAVATGTEKQRIAAFESGAPIVVANFDVVEWAVARYGRQIDSLLIDEITKLKTPGGLRFRKLRHWVKSLKWRAGMTGSPTVEDLLDLYGQVMLIDGGRTFGTRKDAYRREYFTPQDYQQRQWLPMPGAIPAIARRLVSGGTAYWADDRSYRDALPVLRETFCDVRLRDDTMAHYDTLKRLGRIEELEGPGMPRSAGVKALKRALLATGGLYSEEGEVVWRDTTKIDYALSTATREPTVLVYQYRWELAELRARLPEAPVLGDGAAGFGPREQAAWDAGDTPWLLLHPRSAAHGINLQYGGRRVLQLSPFHAADPWVQVIGRVRRRGQASGWVERRVLVAVDTDDIGMVESQQAKAARNDEFTEAMAGLK
jgi:hypothetical protein